MYLHIVCAFFYNYCMSMQPDLFILSEHADLLKKLHEWDIAYHQNDAPIVDDATYEHTITGAFAKSNGTFTYIFDMRESDLKIYLYLDGKYHKMFTSADHNKIITSFVLNLYGTEEMYGNQSVGSMYLYGFKNAPQYLEEHLANTGLDLTDCKDSMLYKGE